MQRVTETCNECNILSRISSPTSYRSHLKVFSRWHVLIITIKQKLILSINILLSIIGCFDQGGNPSHFLLSKLAQKRQLHTTIINPVSTHACNLSKECNILTPYHMWYGFKMVGNFCKKILKAHMLKRAQLESKNSLRGGLEPV